VSTLAYALEALCKYAESETVDRRPKDKHGPVGRPPVARIDVADLRGLMTLHNDEGFRAIAEAAAAAETAEKIATIAEEAADDLDLPVMGDWLEYRDWFKSQLHQLAAQAREAGGVS
jgi:hypothetical protein